MVHLSRHQSDTTARNATRWSRAWNRWFGDNEPRPRAGPFSRWPRVADGFLAGGVFVASVIAVAANRLETGEDFSAAAVRDLPPAAFPILALAAIALQWRRHHPIAVAAAGLTAAVVWAVLGYGEGQDLALFFGLYAVGRYVSEHRHSLAAVTASVTVALVGSVIDNQRSVDVAAALLFVWLPWYIGRRVRDRGDYLALLKDRAARLEQEQHAQARRAVADERSRIARELHDVVAHRVSMMTVQAGAAKTIARDNLDAAVEAMGDVERAGRQALGELRHLLGVLRPDNTDPEHLGPQPGIADIAALTHQVGQTGAEVTLTLPAMPEDLPAAIDLSTYRIVQEGLTNVIKHAGPRPNVEVSVTNDADQLTIEITNTTTRSANALPRSGYGIAGMRERAELLGGTLDTGPQPGNRFRVLARIPLDPEPT